MWCVSRNYASVRSSKHNQVDWCLPVITDVYCYGVGRVWRGLYVPTSCVISLNISQTFWHRLPIFQVDLHCTLHRVATSSCRGHVDELATEPFLLLHHEHGTGYQRSWNCYDRQTCFVVIWKHLCYILSTGTRIRIESVMHPQSSSRGHNTSASVTVTVIRLYKAPCLTGLSGCSTPTDRYELLVFLQCFIKSCTVVSAYEHNTKY